MFVVVHVVVRFVVMSSGDRGYSAVMDRRPNHTAAARSNLEISISGLGRLQLADLT
jgi:hypothetical protein